uniref:Reverse transcriptase domain-containing protein n=1 Tax=Peronospora matthiolae TaxID=2874970 RepID=A0AAV1TUS4_9STRA
MVPALLTVSNEILSGAPMPPSFLEALVVPLRKKGDLADSIDYRPISLLQTSYKIFAKILATHLQTVMPRLVGDSRKGFVRGRQMRTLVNIMLFQLASASNEMDLPARASRVILLLDFRKACDTVDREFLYAALRAFHLKTSLSISSSACIPELQLGSP